MFAWISPAQEFSEPASSPVPSLYNAIWVEREGLLVCTSAYRRKSSKKLNSLLVEEGLARPVYLRSIPDSSLASVRIAQAMRGVLWARPNRPWESSTMMPPCPFNRSFK